MLHPGFQNHGGFGNDVWDLECEVKFMYIPFQVDIAMISKLIKE